MSIYTPTFVTAVQTQFIVLSIFESLGDVASLILKIVHIDNFLRRRWVTQCTYSLYLAYLSQALSD